MMACSRATLLSRCQNQESHRHTPTPAHSQFRLAEHRPPFNFSVKRSCRRQNKGRLTPGLKKRMGLIPKSESSPRARGGNDDRCLLHSWRMACAGSFMLSLSAGASPDQRCALPRADQSQGWSLSP